MLSALKTAISYLVPELVLGARYPAPLDPWGVMFVPDAKVVKASLPSIEYDKGLPNSEVDLYVIITL